MVSTMTSEKQVTIPEGYKQTEVGVKNSSGTNFNDACGGPKGGGMDSRRIPEDWSIKLIGSALTIRHGRDQKQVQCSDGVYPILGTGGEMGRTNTFIYDKPSVLIGRKGSINKPRFMDTPFWTVDTLFYSEVNTNYSAKFLFYKFCMIDWMSYNEASGVPSLNASTIESVFLSYPQDKQEQEIIANALSDVDNLIASLETLIAKKNAIKTAAMQQLLTGKKRLPGFLEESAKESAKERVKESEKQATAQIQAQAAKQNSDQPADSAAMANASQIKTAQRQHAAIQGQPNQSSAQTAPRPGYKQTELGETNSSGTNLDAGIGGPKGGGMDSRRIPEDWDLVELGSVAKYIGSGKTNTKGSGEYPLYGSTGKIGSCEEAEYQGDSILVARVGANAGSLNYVSGHYGVSDNTIMINLGDESNIHFYEYQLTKFNLNSLVFGSGQPLITGSQLKAISLPTPSFEEQTAIANVLSDMDTELDALQQRLTKTQKIKQGMMQELLTGKTRLI